MYVTCVTNIPTSSSRLLSLYIYYARHNGRQAFPAFHVSPAARAARWHFAQKGARFDLMVWLYQDYGRLVGTGYRMARRGDIATPFLNTRRRRLLRGFGCSQTKQPLPACAHHRHAYTHTATTPLYPCACLLSPSLHMLYIAVYPPALLPLRGCPTFHAAIPSRSGSAFSPSRQAASPDVGLPRVCTLRNALVSFKHTATGWFVMALSSAASHRGRTQRLTVGGWNDGALRTR